MRVNTIEQGVLSGALGDLYLFIKSSAFNEQLEKILQETEITPELDIIQAIIDDFANQAESKAVKVASNQVKSHINEILAVLKSIQQEFEYHKTRYFSNWRSPMIIDHIKTLKEEQRALADRRELLVSVLNTKRSPRPLPPIPKKSFIDRFIEQL